MKMKMKKFNLNLTYKYLKNEIEKAKETSGAVRVATLHGIYQNAYEYVKNGGKRDLEPLLNKLKGL